MQILKEGTKIAKIWTDEPLSPDEELQLRNALKLPFMYPFVTQMPDKQPGYGVTIGCVLPCLDHVVPNAVGADIGCGIGVVKYDIDASSMSIEQKRELRKAIKDSIPNGMGHIRLGGAFRNDNEKAVDYVARFGGDKAWSSDYDRYVMEVGLEVNNCLGTLGGNNHFMEVQEDEEGKVWVMVHCGSRGVGYHYADRHNEIAKKLNQDYLSIVEPEWRLAFLPLKSDEGQTYMKDMEFSLALAKANRRFILEAIYGIFTRVLKRPITELARYDVHHNYASIENHGSKNVVVHRKGAIMARNGRVCLIPGSQLTGAFIGKGLGNKDSLHSCSHGAGRTGSRTSALNSLDLQAEKDKMDKAGIIHGVTTTDSLKEADGGFKDIANVMDDQRALVVPMHKLTPLIAIKGVDRKFKGKR